MEEKIAILMDSGSQTISLQENGIVKLFQKGEYWKVIKEIPFTIEDAQDLQEIQSKLRAVAEELGDCRILVTAKARGISAAILEGLGCILWEASGRPDDYFDQIFDEMALSTGNSCLKTVPMPMPIPRDGEGRYFLDLRENPENQGMEHIPSKKILQPFFRKVPFSELEILCEHVPCWFESELSQFKLQAEIETLEDNLLKVKIVPLRRKEG